VEIIFGRIKSEVWASGCKVNGTAQINEALCKVLCHNLSVVIQSMYELGVEPPLRVEAVLKWRLHGESTFRAIRRARSGQG
jgi:hypothetical protein